MPKVSREGVRRERLGAGEDIERYGIYFFSEICDRLAKSGDWDGDLDFRLLGRAGCEARRASVGEKAGGVGVDLKGLSV